MPQTTWKLFAVAVLIWGSTWYAIKFQLGVVDPMVSIAWRFLAAGLLLHGFCRVLNISTRLTPAQHPWVIAFGFALFCLNYILFYASTIVLTSGLIAVISSTMVLWNALLAAKFLGHELKLRVVLGAFIGFGGLILLFAPDLFMRRFGVVELLAVGLSLVASISASAGNILSMRNQGAGISIVAGNAWGMLYGGGLSLLAAVVLGRPLTFDWSLPYVSSLAYLVVFGSIVAFGSYLWVVSKMGPARAAFVTLLYPVVAMLLSTMFEGYQWTVETTLGAVLVIYGNYMALKQPKLI